MHQHISAQSSVQMWQTRQNAVAGHVQVLGRSGFDGSAVVDKSKPR